MWRAIQHTASIKHNTLTDRPILIFLDNTGNYLQIVLYAGMDDHFTDVYWAIWAKAILKQKALVAQCLNQQVTN